MLTLMQKRDQQNISPVQSNKVVFSLELELCQVTLSWPIRDEQVT